MDDLVTAILMAEKRNSNALKISHRTTKRLWLCKRVLSDIRNKSKSELWILDDIRKDTILIIAHADYSTISVIVDRGDHVEVVKCNDVDIYYSIVDGINENMLSDNTISKRGWEEQLNSINQLKCAKLADNEIGVYTCKLADEYSKKDILTGEVVGTEELKNRLSNTKGAIPTTVLLLLSNIEDIKKILIWDEQGVIGVVQKDGFGYTLDINNRAFKSVVGILTGRVIG